VKERQIVRVGDWGPENGLKAAAILLAAGLSRRMGERNKLLIEIGGEPLVRRTAKVYLAAGVRVHAVLGFEAEKVRAALKDLPVTFIANPRYEEGQQTSVRAGADSLTGDYDAVLVALADQAALAPADIEELLGAFQRCGGGRILVPFHGGLRGNPVVFPEKLIAAARASGQNALSRAFIDSNPQLIEQYEAAHDRFIIDIDTPEDLASFENRAKPAAEK
jgi:molybdenum cofactor cytidylyltransferase